jgi:hypothetical protein
VKDLNYKTCYLLSALLCSLSVFYYVSSCTPAFAIDITGLGTAGISESYLTVKVPPRLGIKQKGTSSLCFNSNLNTRYLISIGYREKDKSSSSLVFTSLGDSDKHQEDIRADLKTTEKCHSGTQISLADIASPSGVAMEAAVLFLEPA